MMPKVCCADINKNVKKEHVTKYILQTIVEHEALTMQMMIGSRHPQAICEFTSCHLFRVSGSCLEAEAGS